jgi:hypothetical protein
MFVLSTLHYWESIYGTARKPVLKTLEADFQTLSEMRELNMTIVVTRIIMNERHSIRHFFTNRRI